MIEAPSIPTNSARCAGLEMLQGLMSSAAIALALLQTKYSSQMPLEPVV